MNRLPNPTFDPRVADWLEDDPSLAPREVLGTVLAAFPSIEQRRASSVPWRLPTMNPAIRLAGAAVLVFAFAGAILLALKSTSNVGPPGSPAPSASSAVTPRPTAPLTAGPLAFGTYYGPVLQAADVIAAVNADKNLTSADRTQVIDVFLGIRDKETLQISIELRGGQLTERETVDGNTVIGTLGRYAFPDDQTLVFTESGTGMVIYFELAVDGESFTLHRTTAQPTPADEFVTRLIFESGPFTSG